ncbi:MAG: hypothetical protein ACD_30C00057G0002 [uncultured bacterium]|uniref:Uncharacterized protein n=3 Tax=Candidatus Daviesiibacteriota TaxID=1752718 RepID=A0A0G0F9V1_9BACT|nr:MAG: hypothetical protein ACD_30C00057G0002 [uncultured bacterium]KKQ10270.1 MAG: hypothetical protein US19_C0007G0015 [Candidatus Daviesbacteria bacterium GW2011_GWB1_36_5]KKQ16371.1 MAG: hypothetical protein US28_C0002G0038 [Candidatus Daviesbacteria bacterium GW2011_GWA1_36_8]OGE32332.1 MAG: hypothetical protein A3C99_02305 [Candidatus Daviesbacteria bacterium RIFCSPHIGHO2_02_FULL_37_9]OGE35523.1 MAG: hypothetical protein A3E66_04810 [Candidatus Daviesbacteria bacterium RIFCSPHIGHO2_12_FU
MNFKNYFFIAFLIIGLGFISFNVSFAFFSNSATSNNNIFAAASVFPTPTPTASANIFVSNAFTCSTGASDTTTPKGTVAFTFNTSTLDLTVTLTSALPNTSYDIWVNQDPGGCPLSSPTFPGGVLTNGSGDGSQTFNTPRLGGATNFWISAVAGSDVFRSTAVSP